MNQKLQSVFMAAFIVVVFLFSISVVFSQANSNAQSSGYYQLTLVIENQTSGDNGIGNMYSFYVLNGNTLEPSSVIKVPFGKEVKITIINYDQGTSMPLTASAENVSGIVGGTIMTSSSISIPLAKYLAPQSAYSVSNISAGEISHTFTTSTGLNIPIFPHSTEVGYTYFNAVGNYSWACMCQCGALSMGSAGSMMGELVVLPP